MRKRIKRTKSVEKNKWAIYEQMKAMIYWQNLPPDEYEKKIKDLIEKLEL